MASSLGRVLLPQRSAVMPNGGVRSYTPSPTFGHERRARRGASHTYLAVSSKFYGNIKVHQAVCEAFHGPKPFADSVVMHLDEDATNNKPDNLAWGSQKENLNMRKVKDYHRAVARIKFGYALK